MSRWYDSDGIDGPWERALRAAMREDARIQARDLHASYFAWCSACARHYGDDGLCDEGKPVASPHRKVPS